jgi:hypothetical protein
MPFIAAALLPPPDLVGAHLVRHRVPLTPLAPPDPWLPFLPPDSQVVLVGDPRQLPPTVLSRAADAARLSQSLFERLQSAGCRVCLLSRQYRMHPAISRSATAGG